jgi:hypothetical protein
VTVGGWIAVGVLSALVIWLGFALMGAVRELADLRARVAALEAPPDRELVRLADGLPVGAPSPGWSVVAPDGRVHTSTEHRGRRHLVLFADADCAACIELLPTVVGAAADQVVPPTVVIGRGALPPAWTDHVDGVRVTVGTDRGGEVSRAFRTEISPHLFVIDEGGFVAAQGGPLSLGDVRTLIREAGELRIVTGAFDG